MDFLSKDAPKNDDQLFKWYRDAGDRAVAVDVLDLERVLEVQVADEAAVTRPLAFTVKDEHAVAVPNDPTLLLTVASVWAPVAFDVMSDETLPNR